MVVVVVAGWSGAMAGTIGVRMRGKERALKDDDDGC